LLNPLPPFVIGHAHFDNGLARRARSCGHAVVDATRSVVAIHQSHDSTHVAGDSDETYGGEEATHNLRLVGTKNNLFLRNDTSHTCDDATHTLYHRGRPVPYLGSKFRIRARAGFEGWINEDCGTMFPIVRAVCLVRKRLGLLDLRERCLRGRIARN
jgi:hypothetical protein